MRYALALQVYDFSISHPERATRMLQGYQGRGGTQLIQMTHLVIPPLAKEGEMLESATKIFSLIRQNYVCG